MNSSAHLKLPGLLSWECPMFISCEGGIDIEVINPLHVWNCAFSSVWWYICISCAPCFYAFYYSWEWLEFELRIPLAGISTVGKQWENVLTFAGGDVLDERNGKRKGERDCGALEGGSFLFLAENVTAQCNRRGSLGRVQGVIPTGELKFLLQGALCSQV